MVPAFDRISLGGNATTPGTGYGTLSYSFTVETRAVGRGGGAIVGFDPAIFFGQTISPATTTIGGGSAITELIWNSNTENVILTITGASNTGWNYLNIGGTIFVRTDATFTSNTWTWAGITTNPFPTGSTTVVFGGVPGTTVNLNQSAEVELYSTYGSASGTLPISLNDAAVRALAGSGFTTPGSAISMSDLYGKTAAFTYNYNLASGSYDTNFDLTTKLYIAGWNGSSPVNATITVGGVLGATDISHYAFQTDTTYPTGSTITVYVNLGAFITGAGGGSASGPSTGGSAMLLQHAITLHNSGVIQGGGGSGDAGNDNFAGAGCGYQVSSANTIGTPIIARMPKRGSAPYLVPVGGLTSDPLGPVAGYDVSASGVIASASAQIYATIESGGSYARDDAGGSNNGGTGGSWVAGVGSTSGGTFTYAPVLGGGGYGGTSPGEGEGSTGVAGSQGPGHSIDGVANISNGINGTIRGATT
jgi:hypothetical protein